ncbi:hypothetical protein PBRA_008338 [Plasmodiophora brassicae]|uniref:GH18 domain-containing protein n=1 Tax=Plasmodiophora brassicae TaxID=37360 RepID=A0A0G4J135_PLABS|nr:hypothetical protein PBRA_008338 [Plasmodiophora brassicae]
MYLLLVFVAAYELAPARAAPQACRNCSSSATGPGTSARIIGHFVNWKSSVLQVAGIDGSLLTEIVYEQFDIVNGQCVVNDVWGDTQKQFGSNVLGDDTNASPYKGNFYQLRLLKQQPGNVGRLRTLIMIGGWSSSSNLSVIASTSAGRRLLASSCTGLARYYGFDGVDVGWQYPVRGGAPKNVYSASDKTNLPLLLAAFRSQDPGLLLTTTIRYQQDTLFPTYDLAAIANQVDWIHADTFGSWGTWSSSTGHYANLYYNLASPNTQTVDGMVQQALAAGVPPCKFILDVPLSFPAWTTSQSVAASFPALFTTGSGYSTGATDGGMFRYRDVVSIASGGSYQFVWDSISAASVLYSTSTLVWIATETTQSTAAKAAYVTSNNLGGVKFLDLSGDTSSFQIVTAMQSALKSAAPCSGQVAAVPLSGAIPGYQQQAPGACAPVTSSAGVPALRTATRVIGRFTNYKQSFLAVADIDGTLLTHVIYESAVANSSWQCDFESAWYDIQQVLGANALGDDTNDPYHGNFNQLRRLKLKYPHLKTILQLGPDVLFSSLLSVPARQSAFVSSCVAMMRQYGFDGLNIYWNNPVTGASYKSDPHLSTDRTQLPVVMQMFRAQMPPGALLTLTMTSMAYEMYAMYDVPGIVPYVDFIEYRNEWMWCVTGRARASLHLLMRCGIQGDLVIFAGTPESVALQYCFDVVCLGRRQYRPASELGRAALQIGLGCARLR